MAKLRLPVELTRSRRGGFASRQIVAIVSSDGVRVIGRPTKLDRSAATYSLGEAGYVDVDPGNGYVVHVRLVRSPTGRISGEITVYNSEGRRVLEMVLRRKKLRRRRGDPGAYRAVEAALRTIGLEPHIRRVNTSTGC